MSDMKILTLDIETSPHLVYTYNLFNTTVLPHMIVEPTWMMCWAAKWLHEEEAIYRAYDDEDFITLLWELMDVSDAIVTYNGISFDRKHIDREMLEAGLAPPTPSADIDLYRTVRSRFKFASNKLDYVSQRLLGKKKVSTGGSGLWLAALNNEEWAWEKIEKYNIGDVELTEELYLFLRGWIKGHPNHGLYVEDQENPVCRNCGSTHIQSRGWQATSVRGYQRYKCMDCGANLRGRNMVKGGTKSPQVLV